MLYCDKEFVFLLSLMSCFAVKDINTPVAVQLKLSFQLKFFSRGAENLMILFNKENTF